MKTLIIGAGEVGKSLFNVIKDYHEAYIRDVEPLELEGVEVLNICFPYFNGFEKVVEDYQRQYKPKLTIIHSTVPVGTSSKLGAVHSPIHGKHPNLESGIRTFTKYVGGEPELAHIASLFMSDAGINTKIVDNAETSELSKLYCTTQYGLNIVIMKEIYEMCKKYGANFEQAYQQWNQSYNHGYELLQMGRFSRYVLDHTEGKIGGHCVIPNCKILDSKLDSKVAKFILESNEMY